MQRMTEPSQVIPIEKLEKLPHLAAFEIDSKTTKGQIPVIEGWNKMRERLLSLGEMESS